MRKHLAAACVFFLLTATSLFAQTGNGTVGGIVQDTTKPLIPGVGITLTNSGTGVVNMLVTNESGAYSFAAGPPGSYKLTAQLPGFKEAVANDVTVGANAQVRYDFTLEVGAVTQQVEVSVTADAVMTESSASVGVLLPEKRVTDLPLVGQNVLDLLNVRREA